ncbi:Methylesterase 4 [Hibiscus syriacus]|uniref:Methylesterase 4 n=1 Tax=Hibiscus syriacus TaxID=106335 RepID=A0A6A2ZTN8_HIBSY|nr:Methylesterase 4 [Hibiscus syriacus]
MNSLFLLRLSFIFCKVLGKDTTGGLVGHSICSIWRTRRVFDVDVFWPQVEDLELAKALIKPGSLFVADLSKTSTLSNETYGSVPRVYIVCNEDEGIPEEFQRWMIDNFMVNDVMEIKGADHMAMLSKPHELFNCLSEIAHKFG